MWNPLHEIPPMPSAKGTSSSSTPVPSSTLESPGDVHRMAEPCSPGQGGYGEPRQEPALQLGPGQQARVSQSSLCLNPLIISQCKQRESTVVACLQGDNAV